MIGRLVILFGYQNRMVLLFLSILANRPPFFKFSLILSLVRREPINSCNGCGSLSEWVSLDE